jgi:hypothetical protein
MITVAGRAPGDAGRLGKPIPVPGWAQGSDAELDGVLCFPYGANIEAWKFSARLDGLSKNSEPS